MDKKPRIDKKIKKLVPNVFKKSVLNDSRSYAVLVSNAALPMLVWTISRWYASNTLTKFENMFETYIK